VLELEKTVAEKEGEQDRQNMSWTHEKETLERRVAEVLLDYNRVKSVLENKEGQSKQTMEHLAKEHE
jgi:hypothetical protein